MNNILLINKATPHWDTSWWLYRIHEYDTPFERLNRDRTLVQMKIKYKRAEYVDYSQPLRSMCMFLMPEGCCATLRYPLIVHSTVHEICLRLFEHVCYFRSFWAAQVYSCPLACYWSSPVPAKLVNQLPLLHSANSHSYPRYIYYTWNVEQDLSTNNKYQIQIRKIQEKETIPLTMIVLPWDCLGLSFCWWV